MKFVTFENVDGKSQSGILLDNDLVLDLFEATKGKITRKAD